MKGNILTPKFFAHLALTRYIEKKKDTFIIIYGKPRTGKTNLGFNFLINYLKLSRKAYKKGLIPFKPPNSWRQIFKRYFTDSAEDMSKKIKHNEEASPVFLDEGQDVLSWHDVLTKEQQDLIELLMKTGKKGNFTILITPQLSLLTKGILARAHYMFIIPHEFRDTKWNSALVLRNYDNPILAEQNPFGIYPIIKKVVKKAGAYSDIDKFINLIVKQNTYKGVCPFHFINPKLYDLYDKIVKEPIIMNEKRRKRRYVTRQTYDKLKYMFDNLLYNLNKRDGKTLAQIESLLTDKFGQVLLTRRTIGKYINIIESLQVKPNFNEGDMIEDVVKIPEDDDTDLEFDPDNNLNSPSEHSVNIDNSLDEKNNK